MIRAIVAAALFAFAAPVSAQTFAPPRMSEADQAAVQRAIDRGTMIYYYDQAAWHGTDDMLAKMPQPNGKIGGWLVDGPAAASELVFYDKNEADPHAVYVAEFSFGKLISSHVLGPGDDTGLSPARKAMIAARNAASDALKASGQQRCKENAYNTVVLPPATPGGNTLVYFLTPQTSNDSIPMGGHYLVEVTAGGKAGAVRPFTKACLELPLDQGNGEHGKPTALVVTHLLDPTPTEIHVFATFTLHLPLYVGTSSGGRLWAVELVEGKTRIRLVDPKTVAK